MRQDMGKVITEAPRYGSSNPSRKTRLSIPWKGWDGNYDIPTRMSMSRHIQHAYGASKWSPRQFSDVLGPIRRWLDRQVGRPWDDIYSEISKTLDKRKLTHAHVVEHIMNWIEFWAFKGRDGIWRSWPFGGKISGYRSYFIDPETGILRKQILPKEQRKPEPVEKVKVDDVRTFELKKGIWYLVEYKTLDPEEIVLYRNPSNFSETLSPWLYHRDSNLYNHYVPVRRKELHPRGEKVVVRKKQASKKELRLLRSLLGVGGKA